jgi:hypothetical protein
MNNCSAPDVNRNKHRLRVVTSEYFFEGCGSDVDGAVASARLLIDTIHYEHTFGANMLVGVWIFEADTFTCEASAPTRFVLSVPNNAAVIK